MSTDHTDQRQIIDASNPTVRWRFECQNGHSIGGLKPARHNYRCRTCERDPEIDDPRHRELVDKRSGETVAWHTVEFRGR